MSPAPAPTLTTRFAVSKTPPTAGLDLPTPTHRNPGLHPLRATTLAWSQPREGNARPRVLVLPFAPESQPDLFAMGDYSLQFLNFLPSSLSRQSNGKGNLK